MSHARSEYEDFKALAPDVYESVLALGKIAAKAGIDKQLLELIKIRASQINGVITGSDQNLVSDCNRTEAPAFVLRVFFRRAGIHFA